jgi:hypothetical protein
MLILFGRDRTTVTIPHDVMRNKRCAFSLQVPAYTARQMEPNVRDTFEKHLIDCERCQRAVFLESVSSASTPSDPHTPSGGTPCAVQTRRKS